MAGLLRNICNYMYCTYEGVRGASGCIAEGGWEKQKEANREKGFSKMYEMERAPLSNG